MSLNDVRRHHQSSLRPNEDADSAEVATTSPGQETVAVTAGHVDQPVVEWTGRADGDTNGAGSGQWLDEPGLAGELVGFVGQQVDDWCGAEPCHGGRLLDQPLGVGPPSRGEGVGLSAEQFGVHEQVGDEPVQLVEPLPVAVVRRAGDGDEVGALRRRRCTDMGGELA